ncbi:MAG: cytochrome b/b6 domain-containing protein [Elusimicrobia bacterium]|nr:cytochrome b/b6 domain-containing protein [Elusimicrobiota bacterium]
MPHPEKMAKPDCAMCHADEGRELKASPHGRALLKRFGTTAGACEACHGFIHAVLPVKEKASPVTRLNQLTTCGSCHAEDGKTPPYIEARHPVASYRKTVHGEALVKGSTAAASCADCHRAHDIRPGLDSESSVFKANIAATCGRCHAAEAGLYRRSVHGQALAGGVKEAPTCTDCHGEHTIRAPEDAASSVSSGAVTQTCARCHASERLIEKFNLPSNRLGTYMASYHGLAAEDGSVRVANCASCHGWHDILPSSDPASRINPANISRTCGQCHAGAELRLSAGRIHQSLADAGGGSRAAHLFRLMYLVLIPLTIGGMLLHNLLDLLHKALTGDRRSLRAEEEPMLTVSERVQHAFLAVSFVLLAYSGFALQWPGHWWGAPFDWFGGELFRRQAHRAAAVVFVLLAAAHMAYLAAAKKGRARLRALLPAPRDLRDPAHVLAYNAGLTKKRPAMPRFSYIEKAEYWALVWGSGVMVATGAVLLFNSLALRWLPLWVIESARVIHFMEAVLACLAILVWHGYWVVFDPEVYPMNWAWLTGRVRLEPEDEEGEERG